MKRGDAGAWRQSRDRAFLRRERCSWRHSGCAYQQAATESGLGDKRRRSGSTGGGHGLVGENERRRKVHTLAPGHVARRSSAGKTIGAFGKVRCAAAADAGLRGGGATQRTSSSRNGRLGAIRREYGLQRYR